MAVEGGMKLVKFLVFFFNFLFWLCGLAVIVVGVLVRVKLNSVLVTNESNSAAAIVLIVVGVVIFFVSFFGCCGAWKENYCMVTMFAILLGLVFIVQIGAAIAGYVLKGDLDKVVSDGFKEMMAKYNSNKEIKDSVDTLQRDLRCCGINSSVDWKGFNNTDTDVPQSCCRIPTTNCGNDAMYDGSKIYLQGCKVSLEEELQKNIKWVIVAALVIAAVEILGIVFACVLMKGIRNGYEVM